MALAVELGEKHQKIIKRLATDPAPAADTQAVPAACIGTAPARVVVTDALALRRQASWVRPTIAVLPDLVRDLDIVELTAGEVTPKIQRLIDRIYRSNDPDQVMDAGERLDSRIRMKRSEQQNVLLQSENDELRAEVHGLRGDLQTLADKPADPAIGKLQQEVDSLAYRQNEIRPRLTAAQDSATSAHAAVLALTPQLNTVHALQSEQVQLRTLNSTLKTHLHAVNDDLQITKDTLTSMQADFRTSKENLANLKENQFDRASGERLQGNVENLGERLDTTQLDLNNVKHNSKSAIDGFSTLAPQVAHANGLANKLEAGTLAAEKKLREMHADLIHVKNDLKLLDRKQSETASELRTAAKHADQRIDIMKSDLTAVQSDLADLKPQVVYVRSGLDALTNGLTTLQELLQNSANKDEVEQFDNEVQKLRQRDEEKDNQLKKLKLDLNNVLDALEKLDSTASTSATSAGGQTMLLLNRQSNHAGNLPLQNARQFEEITSRSNEFAVSLAALHEGLANAAHTVSDNSEPQQTRLLENIRLAYTVSDKFEQWRAQLTAFAAENLR